LDRRSFIQLTAVTGTSATLASCGHPEHQIIRFIPEEEHVPGIAEWKPSMCPLCHAGCGVLVRVMEGDADVVRDGQTGVMRRGLAKKLEGNPSHPVNQGALCARGQAAIQVTYHPDRLTHPLKRTGPRGSGQFQEVTWDAAIAELVDRLESLRRANGQRALAFVTRPRPSARSVLASAFLERFGAPSIVTYDLFGDDVLRRANSLSFGREQLPTFDLAQSRLVIGFGADFLGTWNSPVSQNAAYGRMRQGRRGVRGAFVQIEPRMSQTGANADEWVPIRPGTEGVLALGLAHLLVNGKRSAGDVVTRAGSLIDGWGSGLAAYTPSDVERRTGVSAARVERLAKMLADDRPAVAIIGGAPLAHSNGLFSALAVNLLNAVLGAVGEPGGLSFMPHLPGSAPAANKIQSLQKLAADVTGGDRGAAQLLLVDEGNPVFAAPPAWRVRDAVLKIPYVASFGSFLDETSSLADLVLPDHSFLESWVEGRPESGAAVPVVTVAGPVLRPLHDTRATPDVLLQVAERLDLKLPWKTFDEMLMATYAALPATPDGEVWSTALKQGGWWGPAPGAENSRQPSASRSSASAGAQSAERSRGPYHDQDPQFDGDAATYPFFFLPYPSQAFLDGSLAHLPWLQEMPDVISTAMWSTWIEINPQTARRLGIAEGDTVEIASTQGSVRAPALLSPGIAPDIVAMPVGQGHETFTRYASGRGVNPIKLLAPVVESETGSVAWAATRVRIARAGGASGDLILFAGEKRLHPFGEER
jgi:anaerobic selenocysteine-containing dehydrogenase